MKSTCTRGKNVDTGSRRSEPIILSDFLPQFYQGRVCKYASGLSTRAIAVTVTQIHRTKNAPGRGELDVNSCWFHRYSTDFYSFVLANRKM
ncbi:hypothetical protein AVEN_72744-1 [Araneus ventricosus]|uniref:Uncharacterized protein n=1 Tax=Araneus ventricosus TaxID=182803 RepID=A0A4Y2DS17_ARAVE|nr:hypothetical protein AVEN_72744-1 [Araneus ventricosus]